MKPKLTDVSIESENQVLLKYSDKSSRRVKLNQINQLSAAEQHEIRRRLSIRQQFLKRLPPWIPLVAVGAAAALALIATPRGWQFIYPGTGLGLPTVMAEPGLGYFEAKSVPSPNRPASTDSPKPAASNAASAVTGSHEQSKTKDQKEPKGPEDKLDKPDHHRTDPDPDSGHDKH